MAIARWNPWGELFGLTDGVDELFRRTLMPAQHQVAFLPLDVRQTDEAYHIEASVPGFRPDEVEVTMDDNVLTIRAQHVGTEEGDRRGGYVRRERRQASVFRQVGLPAEIRGDDISASFENGVLLITVPRAQRSQPRRITVSSPGVAEGTVVDTPALSGGHDRD